MASIKKRADGMYRARYRDAAGKEHARHFTRRIDAQQWLDGITASVAAGTYTDPKTARTTVAQWCDTWLSGYATRRASTVRQARVHVAQIKAEFGAMPLSAVRPSHVRSWTSRLHDGGLSASYVDTNPYPASGCSDSVTPGNCITDAQLQTEIQAVMTLKGWTGGFNKIFIVFTSTGEGSCFDSTSSSCAYTQYCAYHGNFGSTTIPVIYANMPYANPSYCYSSSSGQHDPSGDIPSDANVNVTSHEITEANTDPLVAAGPFGWYDTANGEEIGDLCAWQFGTADWDGGLANQMWNGHFYDLQLEYDNHTSTCVKLGP